MLHSAPPHLQLGAPLEQKVQARLACRRLLVVLLRRAPLAAVGLGPLLRRGGAVQRGQLAVLVDVPLGKPGRLVGW